MDLQINNGCRLSRRRRNRCGLGNGGRQWRCGVPKQHRRGHDRHGNRRRRGGPIRDHGERNRIRGDSRRGGNVKRGGGPIRGRGDRRCMVGPSEGRRPRARRTKAGATHLLKSCNFDLGK